MNKSNLITALTALPLLLCTSLGMAGNVQQDDTAAAPVAVQSGQATSDSHRVRARHISVDEAQRLLRERQAARVNNRNRSVAAHAAGNQDKKVVPEKSVVETKQAPVAQQASKEKEPVQKQAPAAQQASKEKEPVQKQAPAAQQASKEKEPAQKQAPAAQQDNAAQQQAKQS